MGTVTRPTDKRASGPRNSGETLVFWLLGMLGGLGVLAVLIVAAVGHDAIAQLDGYAFGAISAVVGSAAGAIAHVYARRRRK